MYSGRAEKTIQACRFCWMCRHVCPIGLKTGKESHNPRGKALLLSLDGKGVDLLNDLARDIFECCLCNACAENCETGYEPAVFIREARQKVYINNMAPECVEAVIEHALKTGSIYKETEKKKSFFSEISKGLPETADVLIYLGESAATHCPEMAFSLVNLLKKAGIDFMVNKQEVPSGAELYDLLGGVEEVQRIARICTEQINTSKAKDIVVLDPTNARMFKQEYPTWGCEVKGNVSTATSFVDKLIKDQKLVVRKTLKTVTFHDPCRLARDLKETLPARSILSTMGLTIKEMFQHGSLTKCCGGEVLASHSKFLATLTAEGRLDDVRRIGVDTVVCACPSCVNNLTHDKSEIKVIDLFSLLDSNC